MKNLLSETIEILSDNNKTESDVLWVGDLTAYFSWEHFKKIASVDYDNGFGGAEIIQCLKVVGNDFWLERHEYDGSEWWEYKELPKKPVLLFELPSVKAREIKPQKEGVYVWSDDTILEIRNKFLPTPLTANEDK